MAKRRRKKSLGSSSGRYVVSGPAGYRRSLHKTHSAAMDAGHACSRKFPNGICRVEEGLPGMQRLVAECNRNECYSAGGGVGRRRRRRKARR